MSQVDRYTRQRRLAEVGEAGQARLERARAEVRGPEGATVELTYLERAGVGSVTVLPKGTPVPFAHAEWFRFEASRDVGAGAWRALDTIRGALDIKR